MLVVGSLIKSKAASSKDHLALFLTRSNSYVFETTSLSSNEQDLKTELTDFIPDIGDGLYHVISSSPESVPKFRPLPLYSSSNRVLFSFDRSTVYLINYDLLKKEYSDLKSVPIADIFLPEDSGQDILAMVCLDDHCCYFETIHKQTKVRNLTQIIFEFSNETKVLSFEPQKVYYKVFENYRESDDCDVQMVSDQQNFLRYCEGMPTTNVFIVFSDYKRDPLQPDVLRNRALSKVTLQVLPNYLKVLFLEDTTLYKFDIDNLNKPRIKLLQENVVSYFQVETANLYYIDTHNRLYFKDITDTLRFQMQGSCDSITWFHVEDVFFVCTESLSDDLLEIRIFLTLYGHFQMIQLEKSDILGLQLMDRMRFLLFFTYNSDQDKHYLLSFRIFKVLLVLFLPDDHDSAEQCEYFMKFCSRYDISYGDDINYSIFKFEPEEYSYQYAIDFLYRSKKLETVDWKYLNEDNHIVIDDYIMGFIRDTRISPADSMTGDPLTIRNDTYELFLLSSFQFSIPQTSVGIILTQFFLSSNSHFISGIIYVNSGAAA